MNKIYFGFEAGLSSCFDVGHIPPPKATHSKECLSSKGEAYKRQKFYTLPLSCIKRGCTLSTWTPIHDKSHLRLHCGVSLQHTLQDLITKNIITSRSFYETIDFYKQALYETIKVIEKLQFSKKRKPPIKIKGKITNYKKENNQCILYLESVNIMIDRITIKTKSVKVSAVSDIENVKGGRART